MPHSIPHQLAKETARSAPPVRRRPAKPRQAAAVRRLYAHRARKSKRRAAKALRSYAARARGAGLAPEPRMSMAEIALATIGTMLALALMELLAFKVDAPLLFSGLASTAILVFTVPDSPLVQPRAILGGHLLGGLIGFAAVAIDLPQEVSVPLSLGLTVALMLWTRTFHAPAGATPLVILYSRPDLSFLITPIMAGALAIVLLGVALNNLLPGRVYPRTWR